MKKIIFQCVSNTILFTLFGLAFLFPFSNISQTENGFSGSITVFPLLLGAYLLIYPVIYYVLAKMYKWNKKDNSELAFSDEREKVIMSEAAKTAYKVLIGGLIAIMASIGGLKFFSMSMNVDISIYLASIALLTILLVVATVTYCVIWCLEYRK